MPLFGPPDVEKLEAKRDVSRLISLLAYRQIHGVNASAARALARIGAPAVEPLVVALGDENHDVRHAAAWALGQIGDARAVEALIAALKDGERSVREVAIQALGQMGDPRSVEPLGVALRDEENRVRLAAAAALDRLGWTPDGGEAGAAYWALRLAARVKELTAALTDQDRGVRKAAIDALSGIGGNSAVEPLIGAMKDQDWSLRKAAAEGLVAIYRSGRLDEAQKAKLLCQRQEITQPHCDHSGSEWVRLPAQEVSGGWSASDCGHSDSHTDEGIGVAFPL